MDNELGCLTLISKNEEATESRAPLAIRGLSPLHVEVPVLSREWAIFIIIDCKSRFKCLFLTQDKIIFLL